MPGESRYSSYQRPQPEPGPIQPALPLKVDWKKPSGNRNDPPPEQGEVHTRLNRPGRGGASDTEVRLTLLVADSGAAYGRGQVWWKDAQGNWWPKPGGGVTIRVAEIPQWRTYLDWLDGQVAKKRGGR